VIAEPNIASNVQQAVPFLWVYDMERCIRYYVDGLGCTMTKQMWVPELSDPNGYHLLFESPTDEPEETMLQP
jgi:catechol 2,3-dioxygenase-like lactoylglutathione lyase family enzyme